MQETKTAAEPVHQQDIERTLGITLGTACLPTTFYIEARRLGYANAQDLSPADFVGPCMQHDPQTGELTLSQRGVLSREVRQRYGMRVVSWNTVNQPQDLDAMQRAGYLGTSEERQFFEEEVSGRSPLELVRAGYHVVAGMAPHFGTNRDVHAVVLQLPSDSELVAQGMIEVIDPDERNPKSIYTSDYIERSLQPGGACSIILPPAPEPIQ